jgi:hypothetical protein
MAKKSKRKQIPIRTSFYIAVEGKSEQSFIKFLQQIADQNGVSVHLEAHPLNGGGYQSMLQNAEKHRKNHFRNRTKPEYSILLIDEDRAQTNEDSWTIERLKKEALREKFVVSLLSPNLEGLYYRMFEGNEKKQPDYANIRNLLKAKWPEYKKNTDATTLMDKFNKNVLFEAAKYDDELKQLLLLVGFKL